MFIRTEHITPERAQAYLDKNDGNRPVSQKHVAFLAQQMLSGTWKPNTGETLKISKSGRVLDGQHRFHAIIKSGVSLDLQVADGCEDEIFDVLDTGRNRNAADALAIGGFKYSSKLSTPIRFLINYERGTLRRAERLSNADCVTYARLHPELEASCRFTDAALKKMPLVSFADLVIMHALLSRASAGIAEVFLDTVVRGAGLADGSPALLLRQKFEKHKMGSSNLSLAEKIALCIKAWNLMRRQQTVTLLVFRPDQEDFPKPV